MMLQNKQGASLIGLLVVVVIILALISVALKQTVKKGTTKKPQLSQTIQNVRSSVKVAEQAAAKRANLDKNFYK